MYSKEELSAKDMAELQDIAHEMGIEPSTEGNAEELVYAILDRQAEIEGNKNRSEPSVVAPESPRKTPTECTP